MTTLFKWLLFAFFFICLACSSDAQLSLKNSVGGLNTSLSAESKISGLSILSHNLFLLPEGVSGKWGNGERAIRLCQHSYLKNKDILIFQEVLDEQASKILFSGLIKDYPYRTAIIGEAEELWDKSLGVPESDKFNGGVVIFSKYPILEKVQYISKHAVDWDMFADKGFVHIKIEKDKQIYNIIGVHLNATHDRPFDYEGVRKKQLEELKSYILENIPKEETLYVGGDFNIIRGTKEYHDMLELMDFEEPKYLGKTSTFDSDNEIVTLRYDKIKSEYLDYIFTSRVHKKPIISYNLAFAPVFDQDILVENKRRYHELSDHYPVISFNEMNKNLPKRDEHYNVYNQVRFKHVETGKYLKVDTKKYLALTNNKEKKSTLFNLRNTSTPDYKEIKSFRKIEVSTFVKNKECTCFFKKPKSEVLSYEGESHYETFYIEIFTLEDDKNRNLKNGDIVGFYIYSMFPFMIGQYLRPENSIFSKRLDFFNKGMMIASRFEVELNSEKQLDWSSEL